VHSLPGHSEVRRTIKNYQSVQIAKKICVLIFSVVLLATMIYVIFFYKSTMLATRLGESLMVIAVLIVLFSNAKSLKKTTSSEWNNQQFIRYLKEVQQRKIQYQKRNQVLGILISSIGLLLYIYEGVHNNWLTLIIGYSSVLGWIGFCWFILRPLSIKRKSKKINVIIQKLESISSQFNKG
jgi:uncharacterized membrane protein